MTSNATAVGTKKLIKTNAQNGTTNRPDIWLHDSCVVCQSKHYSDADKEAHARTQSHIKRVRVYDFFSKESGSLGPTQIRSVLLDRYKRARSLALGLECLHELIMPFSSSPWWACSICYVAGANLDRIDEHVHSFGHKRIYIDEFHPDKLDLSNMDKITSMEKYHSVGSKIFEEQGKYETPEVLKLEGVNKNWVLQKLGLEPNDEAPNYTVGKVFGGHEALHCNVCHTILISIEETRQRCWNTHLSTKDHQRMQMIASAITDLESHEVENPFSGLVTQNQWRRQNNSGIYTGPLTGLRYLLYFGNVPYCSLCYCAVNKKAVAEHFCSENHIFKYLSSRLPGEMYMTMYLPDSVRRTEMQTMLGKLSGDRLGGRPTKIMIDGIPKLICDASNTEILSFPPHMPPLDALGFDQSCFWCPVCWRIIKVPAREDVQNQVWTEHVTKSKRHFQMAVRRGLFNFDDSNITDLFSTLKLPHEKSESVWSKAKLDGVMVEVQKQCDVGLDWIVDDLEANEVVCTACASIFPRTDVSVIALHVRSMDHLMQYLHTANRSLFALVKAQSTPQAERDILMDFLRKSDGEITGRIRVHSIDMARKIESWGVVPCRQIELCSVTEQVRPIYNCLLEIIDTVADDLMETVKIPMKNALQSSSVRVHSIVTSQDDSCHVIFWCWSCQHAFCSSENDIITNVWDVHLRSNEHMARATTLSNNRCNPGGFFDTKPKFAPPIVDQAASKKKITWHWNDKFKKFEYIYTVVGFSDMIERRSMRVGAPYEANVFCALCAEELAHSQAAVDLHVRSLEHVINYVHKYHTHRLKEMLDKQAVNDDGKELRRFLGQLLKDEGAPNNMRVYDPNGMHEERKKIAAEQESNRQREEARKKFEERKRMFEAALRQEEEMHKERRRKEVERRRREIQHELVIQRREREKQQREEERKRKRDEERRRKEEEERKEKERKKQEEARRRQKLLAIERDRKRQEEERKAKLERERRECEERLAKLQKAEQEAARAKQAEMERQRMMQMRRTLERERMDMLRQQAQQRILQDEKRIENELIRLQQEKEGLYMWQSKNQDPRANYEMPAAMYNERRQQMAATMDQPSHFTPTSRLLGSASGNVSGMRIGATHTPEYRSPSAQAVSLFDIETHKSELVWEATRAKKMESFANALKKINSRELLVDFFWRHGSEAIPEAELPVQFNKAVARRTNAIGLTSVYQVICWDRPQLQTMYCSMCTVWTTVSEMLKHLVTSEHRIHYLFRNYKMYHKTAMNQANETVQAQLLEQFAQQIWKLEGPGEVRYRLRCTLDYDTIVRLWPDHIRYLNDDWMHEGGNAEKSKNDDAVGRTPPPGTDNVSQRMKKPEQLPAYEKSTEREREKFPREKERESGRSREKEKEKTKSREKERITDREKKERESSKTDLTSGSRRAGDIEKSIRLPAQRRSSSRNRSLNRRRSPSASGGRRSRRSSSRQRSPLSRRRRSGSRRLHRSRSRSRHRRSRSRSPAKPLLRFSTLLNEIREIGPKPVGEWSAATKAFLAKIGAEAGDRSPKSSRSRDYSSRHRSTSRELSPSRRHRSRSRSPKASLIDGDRCGNERTELAVKPSLDERLESEMKAGRIGMKVWEGLPAPTFDESGGKESEKRKFPADDVVDEILAKRARMQHVESRPRDPKEDMRKLLGVLVAMQEEIQRSGRVDNSTVNRLYTEMGVSGGIAEADNLVTQLCRMLANESSSSSSSGIRGGGGGGELSSANASFNPTPNLNQFGIAAAKEPSPQSLGYVYPGAPEPERPSLPSPYTGVGGVGLKSAIQMSKQQSTLPQQQQLPQFSFSDALQSSSWKPSPFAQSGFGRGSNPSSTSVFGGNVSFDEERRFEASLPSGKSYSSFPSSSSNPASGMFMTPQAKERENPRQNPDMSSVLSQLPKSFWDVVAEKSGSVPITGMGGVGEDGGSEKPMSIASDDSDGDDGSVIIDERETRKAAEKAKMVEHQRKMLEKQPDLRKWTGANNRAVPASLRYSSSTSTAAAATTVPSNVGRSESWRTERPPATVAPARPYSPPVMPVPANQLPVPSKILPDDGNRRCELSEEDESGRPLSKTQKRRIRRERAKIATEIKSRQNPEPKESKKIATGSAETERSKLPNLFDAVPVWESRPAAKALNVPRLADTVPAFDPEPKRRQIPRLADAPSTWDELGLKVAALISARKQVPAETHQASRGSSIGGSSLSDNTSRILPVKSGNVSTAAAQYGEQSTAAYQVSKPLAYDSSRPSYGLPNAANQQQLTSFSSDLASSLRSDVFWF